MPRPTLIPTLLSLACAAGLSLSAGAVHAQDWPTRPIKLIVPYAAGGPTDTVARQLAVQIGKSLGTPVIVDNRGGAGGVIGVDATVKAAPDGYTFALVAPGPLVGMPNLTKAPYKLDDIKYLTLAARIPSVLVVSTESGIGSLEQLLQKAKAEPDKLSFSSAGPGTTPHIGMALLEDQANVRLTHVPYKGAAPAITAVLANEVNVSMVDLLPVLPHVSTGKMKVLAVAGAERAPQLPAIPTTAEKGLPGVAMETTYGFIAPKGLPAAIEKRFRDAAVAAISAPDMQQQFLKQGAVAVTSTSEAYRQLIQAESDKWRRIITKAKITIN